MKSLLVAFLFISVLAFIGCTSTHKSNDLSRFSNEEIEAYNNDPNNTDKIVCRTEKEIGSRIPKRICRFESAIANRSRQDQRGLKNIQNRQDIGTVRDGG